ncbi:MAG: regulatory protein RecX, partial [Gemmatimonadales bacterium]
ASLPGDALDALGVAPGRELTAAAYARLRELADVEGAHRAALRALARRPHARADLRRRLVQKQHPPAAVDRALERLADRGLLDDARFARGYAATRAIRGRGPARLVRDLQVQGIERRAAEDAVARALAEERIDPLATARAAVARRARQLGALPAAVRRRRLAAYLARRGFGGEVSRRVIEEAVNPGATPRD